MADALGALYVFEGAALGGQVIARHVARTTSERDLPLSFFSGSGSRTGELWRAFGHTLTRWTQASGHEDRVVQGACDCFGALESWLAGAGGEMGMRAARAA